jgi:TRAP-type C4-dicarboxylate transport system substrate-binding protein
VLRVGPQIGDFVMHKSATSRKITSQILMTVTAVAMCGVASAQTLPPGPAIVITSVTQPLPTSQQYTMVDLPYFRDIIPKRTNNRITFKASSMAEMNLGGPEMIRLIRSGQADIGAASLSVVAGDVPFLDGADLAGLNPTVDQARKVAEAFTVAANRELEKFNTRIIAVYGFQAAILWCKKPLAGLADLKGRKVRSYGTSLPELLNAVGAQSVSLSFPETYGALERGVVDCAITGSGNGNAGKWYEVTTNMYTLPLGWATAAYYANLKWWNGLDPAVRTFLEATFKEISDKQWKLGDDGSQDGVDCNMGIADKCKLATLVRNNPMTETKPVKADEALLQKLLGEVILPKWVDRCGARCGDVYNEVAAPITGVRYKK